MKNREKRDLYRKVINYLISNNLMPAISILKELAGITQSEETLGVLEQEEQIYEQMVQYFIKNAPDPQREALKDDIRRKLFSFADILFSKALSSDSHDNLYMQRKRYSKGAGITAGNIAELDKTIKELSKDNLRTFETVMDKLFYNIWLCDKFNKTQIDVLKSYVLDPESSHSLSSVIVSAIILNTLEKFQQDNWMLLADIYQSQIPQLWQRALFGMMLIIIRFDHRLELYPETGSRLKLLASGHEFIDHLEKVAVQLVRTGDTEKVTRKIQEEIIPEMMKLAPKIQDKLNQDQLIQDETGEEKNPDWEKFFEDSPEIYEKMEELNKLQSEGVDLFADTFMRLKNFPFFQFVSNWFFPFDHKHPSLHEPEENGYGSVSVAEFLEIFSETPFMCNSDKYSFSFNILNMPEEQKRMLLGAITGEMKEMIKVHDSDELVKKIKGEEVFHQYAQDIYRFFKVHPSNSETEDPFSMQRQLYQCKVLKPIFEQNLYLARRIGEYYFQQDHFQHAVNVFTFLENEPQESPELFQKLAYCWQMTGDIDKALSYYKKAELFDSNALWNLRKIAWCYHLKSDTDAAIKAYKQAEIIAPDSYQIKRNIGNLYLQKEQIDEALHYYIKAEDLDKGNENSIRPVAWALFLKGELEAAEYHYEQIMDKDFNHNDLLNFGHVKFAKNELSAAHNLYKQSFMHRNNSPDSFVESFDNDRIHLEKLGVKPYEIAFMLDAVLSL